MNKPTVFDKNIQVIPSDLGRDNDGNMILSFTTVLNCKVRNVEKGDRVEWILENGNLFLFVNGKLVGNEEKIAEIGKYNLILNCQGQLVIRDK